MELSQLVLEIVRQEYLLIFVFFMIAVIYSSVGFGGGSSYSAVLSLTGMPFVEVRAISLLCNIVVVSSSTIRFIKAELLNWKKVLPLVLFSVPFAFLGGYIKINPAVFYLTLGVSLIVAAFLMIRNEYSDAKKTMNFKSDYSFLKNALTGSIIGFISGMVGIGGGVFLAPFLHITKWDAPEKIVATSSFFILVNSFSGLLGQLSNPDFQINLPLTVVLVITVFFGGLIGVHLSLKRINVKYIKRVTAILITIVGVKIIYTHL